MATPKKIRLSLIENDPWLEPHEIEINNRFERFEQLLFQIEKLHGSIYNFASAYQYFGFNYDKEQKGWFYREWAPQAYSLHLTGDFNSWNRNSHPLERIENGVWEIFLPDKKYKKILVHESNIKVLVESRIGKHDRIPTYITRAVQNEETKDFTGQLWMPKKSFKWTDGKFKTSSIKEPIIYESHVGMAQEEEKVGSYLEYMKKVLPRIKKMGYNTVQFMAIQEHPYYGSFGYHVSSFFAPSSRCGTPEELKELINEAHNMGLAVIMDIVHSHAVKNLLEGLNEFDGTEHHYFHPGWKGNHPGWDSKLFNYGKWEVIQFLLSNVRYWMEEFHFDGFRFDGVTSMLYHHHGMASFDGLHKYFNDDVDREAVTYLQLANTLIHQINPDAISIAEDVSGMPGLGQKVENGGVGFDYRLGMGIPDYWIKLLKEKQDDEWNVHDIWHTLINRRSDEKTIAYAESHDQALVGDKTIAFRLMDKEMYEFMRTTDESLVIDRGIALHKIIRLFTISLGGEGYLNFMGNEFGHPEWIDFPREGNNWSYQYARRQWSLPDNDLLRYKFLLAFDGVMIDLIKKYGILSFGDATELNLDNVNKTIIFARGGLVFIFNFHPTNSITDYKFIVPKAGTYKIILNSDDANFGGFGRVDNQTIFETDKDNALSIYNTNRTALVLEIVRPKKK